MIRLGKVFLIEIDYSKKANFARIRNIRVRNIEVCLYLHLFPPVVRSFVTAGCHFTRLSVQRCSCYFHLW